MKVRVDQLMVEQGLTESRERAKTTIMSGLVYIGEVRVDKPGQTVEEGTVLTVRGDPVGFVSRGGLKLDKALNSFGIDVKGAMAIDVGASTGGFTDCLLKRGAAHVWAVDVGYGQFAWQLRKDERVTLLERTNIRGVTAETIGTTLDIAVIDVSFISLKLVLPVVHGLLKDDCHVAALVKPQFEAGKGMVGKKGVVREPEIHIKVLRDFVLNAESSGFYVNNLGFSPIRGPEGNIEFLSHLRKDNIVSTCPSIESIVEQAHNNLSAELK